jgi:hypothetical protein
MRILENQVQVCEDQSVCNEKVLPSKRAGLCNISFYLFQRLGKNWIYLQEELL